MRALAPSAASNLGGGDRGEIGSSVAEIARKLGAALRVSIDSALTLSLSLTLTLTLPLPLTITLTLTLTLTTTITLALALALAVALTR